MKIVGRLDQDLPRDGRRFTVLEAHLFIVPRGRRARLSLATAQLASADQANRHSDETQNQVQPDVADGSPGLSLPDQLHRFQAERGKGRKPAKKPECKKTMEDVVGVPTPRRPAEQETNAQAASDVHDERSERETGGDHGTFGEPGECKPQDRADPTSETDGN
ncbi:MAG: hypothetical protein OES25_04125 [Acidobacteriota bacterium]|nr:hypothetical protein [Acidobacteriota bacterium]